MRLVNQAGIPDEKLRAILSLVKVRFIHQRHAVVVLLKEDPEAPGAAFMTGDTIPGGGWREGYNERHMVKVYVPTLERPYPTTQQNPAVGPTGPCPVVTLNSWEEELVLVLAHEFAHVGQYECFDIATVVADADHDYEVQAERAGELVLRLWRERESMRHQMAARR